jgi:putative PIN family toxin of toxin-antitoxin system
MIPRVVLDTNVVVSALLKPQGLEDQVLRLALAGRLLLCVSPQVLAEYGQVLSSPKFKFQPEEVASVLRQLQRAGSLFRPTTKIVNARKLLDLLTTAQI